MPKMHIELVAEAMKATPPEIRGLMVDGKIRVLIGFCDYGKNRVFEFDKMNSLSFGELIKISKRVVLLEGGRQFARLHISFGKKYVLCPTCGLSVKAGGPFWTHYNSKHAVRPYWLNKQDWEAILDGPYQPPPN